MALTRLGGQSGAAQFAYFVEECVQSGLVWGLSVDGADWAMTEDATGQRLFAAWPHERWAAACRHLHWSHRRPTPLRVADFVDLVLPKLAADGAGVAVLPRPDLRCTVVQPRQVRAALELALLE